MLNTYKIEIDGKSWNLPVLKRSVGFLMRMSKVYDRLKQSEREFNQVISENANLVNELYQEYKKKSPKCSLDRFLSKVYPSLEDTRISKLAEKYKLKELELIEAMTEKFKILVKDAEKYLDILDYVTFDLNDMKSSNSFFYILNQLEQASSQTTQTKSISKKKEISIQK